MMYLKETRSIEAKVVDDLCKIVPINYEGEGGSTALSYACQNPSV